MGWDLFARHPDGSSLELIGGSLDPDHGGPLRLADDHLRLRFQDAWFYVRHEARLVDIALKLGALDTSPCAHAIERATGWDTYTTRRMTSDHIAELLDQCSWPHDTEEIPHWAFLSSHRFLTICAEEGLDAETST